MARRLAQVTVLLLPMLQDARGEGFLDSMSSMMDSAQDAFSKATGLAHSAQSHVDSAQSFVDGHVQKAQGYYDQAHAMVDKAQATVDGHIQNAQEFKAKIDSHVDAAKSSIDGHVQKAKSFKDEAKDTFCGLISIESVCSNRSSASSSSQPPACAGGSCCQKSSCYSNLVPGLKCDSDRGDTTCIGASMISGKQGVCECKFGGVCSPQGKCPSMSGPAATRLFEDGKVVPKEEFALPLLTWLMVMGSTLVLGCVAASRRVRNGARPMPASQRQAFIPFVSAAE